MWLNYFQAAIQILQVVNGLLLAVHGSPVATGIIGVILGAAGQIGHVTALNTMPPPKSK